jgi:hypothetical protein
MKITDRSIPTPKIVPISIFLLANCLYAFIEEKSRKTIKAIVYQRYVTLLLDALLFMGYDLGFMDEEKMSVWMRNFIDGFIAVGMKGFFPSTVQMIEGESAITLHSDSDFPYSGKIYPDSNLRYNLKRDDRDLFLNYDTLEHIFILDP